MEEKKLTDEEIVKALECCAMISVNPYLRGECIDCPYFQKHIDCVEGKRSEMDCIDLIHRLQEENAKQKAEIERLKEEKEAWEKSCKLWSGANKSNHLKFTSTLEKLCEERNKNSELQKQVDEYKAKIEQGTLIELPCKVGDTVYYTSPEYYNSLLVEYKVTEISQTREGIRLAVYGSPKEKGLITYLWASFIGKTVFLTREEAEKRLKEQQNG